MTDIDIDTDTLRVGETLTADMETKKGTIYEIPGTSILGCGYDIFDLYADPRSDTTELFDLPQEMKPGFLNIGNKVYKVPLLVTVHQLAAGTRSLIIADKIEDLQESFSLKAGLSGAAGYFSGSIESGFTREVVRHSQWQYILLEDSTHAWLLELPLVDDLRPFVKPDVKNALSSADPKTLFAKYGTHFVREALIGGKCSFGCYISRTHQKTRTEMELEVKAAYTSLTGSLNFQSAAQSDTDYRTFAQTYNAKLNVKGGSPAAAFRLADGNRPGGFGEWAATVDSAPVLVDFTRTSLQGIWELCEDQARRAQLLDYYQKEILPSKKPIVATATKIELEGRYVTDMTSVATDKGSGADRNIEFFAPDLKKHRGFKSLGHYAQGGSSYRYGSQPFGTILVVKETASGAARPALKEPVAFSPVWDDRGSGGKNDINIWRPVAPDGYVALGFVVTESSDRKKQPPKTSAYCVRKDLVDRAGFGNLIWNDRGSGADRDVSLYEIKPNPDNGKATGLFWVQPSYNPASGEVWCPLTAILQMS